MAARKDGRIVETPTEARQARAKRTAAAYRKRCPCGDHHGYRLGGFFPNLIAATLSWRRQCTVACAIAKPGSACRDVLKIIMRGADKEDQGCGLNHHSTFLRCKKAASCADGR
jgi:hypothetical protein